MSQDPGTRQLRLISRAIRGTIVHDVDGEFFVCDLLQSQDDSSNGRGGLVRRDERGDSQNTRSLSCCWLGALAKPRVRPETRFHPTRPTARNSLGNGDWLAQLERRCIFRSRPYRRDSA